MAGCWQLAHPCLWQWRLEGIGFPCSGLGFRVLADLGAFGFEWGLGGFYGLGVDLGGFRKKILSPLIAWAPKKDRSCSFLGT